MTDEKAETQPITIYPSDRAIVEAAQARNGSGFSGAIRFIIREWARSSGLQDALQKPTPPRSIKPRATARVRKAKLSEIPGVDRGAKRLN